jgi:hypothetical protein
VVNVIPDRHAQVSVISERVYSKLIMIGTEVTELRRASGGNREKLVSRCPWNLEFGKI